MVNIVPNKHSHNGELKWSAPDSIVRTQLEQKNYKYVGSFIDVRSVMLNVIICVLNVKSRINLHQYHGFA